MENNADQGQQDPNSNEPPVNQQKEDDDSLIMQGYGNENEQEKGTKLFRR